MSKGVKGVKGDNEQKPGLFGQLLNAVGISTGPSAEEQQRQQAIAAQQRAISTAQADCPGPVHPTDEY